MFMFETALEDSPSEEDLVLLKLELEVEVGEELELNSINTQTSPGIPLSSNSFLFAASFISFDIMLGRADSWILINK